MSLAGLAMREVRHLLRELAGAHLIVEHLPDRYAFHDLLRAYAAELAEHTDSAEQRDATIRRVQDHYLHTAYRSAVVLNPHRDPIELPAPDHAATPEAFTDHHVAIEWFSTEHAVLIAAVRQALWHGLDHHAWALAWSMHTYFNRRGRWHDWAVVWQAGVDTATRLADPLARAHAHRGLSWAYDKLSRHEHARVQLLHALEVWAEAGDPVGQADVHLDLGRGLAIEGRFAEAMHHARHALDLYKEADHPDGLALALNNMGMASVELGDYERGPSAAANPLPCNRKLTTSTARPAPGTALVTPTTTWAITPPPSTAISTRSTCTATSATASRSPRPSRTSATADTPRVTRPAARQTPRRRVTGLSDPPRPR